MSAEQPSSLAAALAAFQAEVPTFKKSKTADVRSERTGKSYTYRYADLGDILPVVGPLMAKHGLSWSAKPGHDDQGEWVLRYVLRHVSDQEDAGEMSLCVDKRCKPQELGSAITYMRRYAMGAQLGLATEEDDDGGAAQGAGRSSSRANGSAPRTAAAPPQKSEDGPTAKQKGAVNGRMSAAGVSPQEASAILQWFCGTAQLDRLPVTGERSVSKLLDALGEHGEGAAQILADITDEAEGGDPRAIAIRTRYFQVSA